MFLRTTNQADYIAVRTRHVQGHRQRKLPRLAAGWTAPSTSQVCSGQSANCQYVAGGNPASISPRLTNRCSCMPEKSGWCGCAGRWKATAFLRPNPSGRENGRVLGDEETGVRVTGTALFRLEVVQIHIRGRSEQERRNLIRTRWLLRRQKWRRASRRKLAMPLLTER